MKSYIRHIFFRMLIIWALLLIAPVISISQPPPTEPTDQQSPVGTDNAPIGSGLVILLALAAGYGVVKIKQHRKRQS